MAQEKTRAEELLKDAHGRVDGWLHETEKYLTFAEKARSEFEKGDLTKRKEILYALGSNLQLLDKKFSVLLPPALERLQKAAPEARIVSRMFEPLNNEADTTDFGGLYSKNPILLRG